MIRILRPALLLTAAIVCAPTPSAAQSPAQLLDQGTQAYGVLDFDAAAVFLRRALRATGANQLNRLERDRALAYLAATEVFRGNTNAAVGAFHELVTFDPRYRMDELIFPPEVTNGFDSVRNEVKAVAVELPDSTMLRFGVDRLSWTIFSSSFHTIGVEVRGPAGARALYDGPIRDSLNVSWDGATQSGATPAEGVNQLVVTSRDAAGRRLRSWEVNLNVLVLRPDTLVHPRAPADSLYLPENASATPGVTALAGGVVAGVLVAAVPNAMSSGTEASGAQYVVGLSLAAGGVIGFFLQRPGHTIAENVEVNRQLRQSWQRDVQRVATENSARLRDTRIVIRTGRPVVNEYQDR